MKYLAHKRKSDGEEQTVCQHLIGTAILSKQFSIKVCVKGEISNVRLTNMGELLGLIHDLGKYSSDFQDYFSEVIHSWHNPSALIKWKRGEVDHSTAGAQYIWNSFNKENKVLVYLAQMISLCVASHHSGLINCISPEGEDKFTLRIEKNFDKTFLNEVIEKCDNKVLMRINDLINSPQTLDEFKEIMRSLLNGKSKLVQSFRIGLLTRFLFSCLIDADRTNTADFENPEREKLRLNNTYPAWDEFLEQLDEYLGKLKVRNKVDLIRQDISLSCKLCGGKKQGIYTLSVPTGGGKTLASLRFAIEHAKKHSLSKIFFIIPYTSIIDQNADVVRNIFSPLCKKYKNEFVLEHHSNLTEDKDTLQSKILAENWDAPIVFTTMVQFMEALFNSGTRGVRRMHQLAESVIIFDEIQTLPVRVVHLFNNAINFLVDMCKSSVILCTATQPCLDKVDKDKGAIELSKNSGNGEIVADVKKLFRDLRRTSVSDERKPGGWSSKKIAELATQELKRSGSVLVIVNTKKQARDLFQTLKGSDSKVAHLSTDMCPAHRRDVLKLVKDSTNPEDLKPIICVSTQLIEAGVDVDFGSVIRYLAGLDSIAQAAGRCNRNGLRESGRVIIINPAEENLELLTDIKEGRRIAERVLNEFGENKETFENDLLHPDVMKLFFHYYFFSRQDEMVYPLSKKIFNEDQNLLNLLSTNTKGLKNYSQNQQNLRHPGYPLLQSFKSAAEVFRVIDSDTQGIIVPYKEGKNIISSLSASKDILKEEKLLRKAQAYSVNCYQNRIAKLGFSAVGALHNILESGILCSKPEHYSLDYGLCDEPDYNSMEYYES
jgi:CRISPR-associated endonuclease/helicase Cas3